MLCKKALIFVISLSCLFLGCVSNPKRTGASFKFGTSGWLAKIVGISVEIDVSVMGEVEDEDTNVVCTNCVPSADGMRGCPSDSERLVE